MKRNLMTVMAVATLAMSGSALALDTSEPILCASTNVFECTDGGACESVLPEDVNAPTFLRFDLKKKQVKVNKSDDPAKVQNFAEIDGRIVMQGVSEGRENAVDGTAWTITIEEDSARMVATAALQQAALVIFGACTEI